MCGIFGILLDERTVHSQAAFEYDLKVLYRVSMARGQDASGLALNDGQSIRILRRGCKATEMIREQDFIEIIGSAFSDGKSGPLAAMGHSRLVTNGSMAIEDNNQPVQAGKIVGVHNGIVTNANNLFLEPVPVAPLQSSVLTPIIEEGSARGDTEMFMQYLNQKLQEGFSLPDSLRIAYRDAEGSASIALMTNEGMDVYLATNTGSLYVAFLPEEKICVFASERVFLETFASQSKLVPGKLAGRIEHLSVGEFMSIGLAPFVVNRGKLLAAPDSLKPKGTHNASVSIPIISVRKSVDNLRRCSKCVLPVSYPGISFDEKNVCNFCRRHQAQEHCGELALRNLLDTYRRNDGRYDCLVGLSGGRDSSYGLHLLKTKYGMNPLAYTYDWGLTTNQSRRNQAKICGQLGVEQIIRAPDIAKKRRHIRENIDAWLKRPEMGMVPLFMAGDKDFYQFGRALRKQYDIDLTVFCSGSLLEQRQFFVGFCGVHNRVVGTARMYSYKTMVKLRLAFYYGMQYVLNPSYFNESFTDSVRSFFTSFVLKDDFLYLYEYLPWDEAEIDKVLRAEYGWEADLAYGSNQWRMGDGQTAFTNYIFYTVAGFSEFDNFRSNQIREGLLTREEALRLIAEDNKPKWGALQYFAYVVGINLDDVLSRINNIPKLY